MGVPQALLLKGPAWGHVQCQRPCRRSPPCYHCLLWAAVELWEQLRAMPALPEQPPPPCLELTPPSPCIPDVQAEVKSRARAPWGFGLGLPPAGLGPTSFQTPSTARYPGRTFSHRPSRAQSTSSVQRASLTQLTRETRVAERISRGVCGNVGGGGGVVLLLRSELVGHHPKGQTQVC